MHDERLTRTTDVVSVFPDRVNNHSSDFSWAELKRLNAGSWFLQVRTAFLPEEAATCRGTWGQSSFIDKRLLSPVLGDRCTVSALKSFPPRKEESLGNRLSNLKGKQGLSWVERRERSLLGRVGVGEAQEWFHRQGRLSSI